MKPNRLFILCVALWSFAAAVRAETNESLASIFTNARRATAAIPVRSSIIYIACHDLGLGDLSCYGQTNFQTPNLDKLAAEGTRFTDYRAGGDTLPLAQAALMTGKNAALKPGELSLAARLQQAGYHTGLVGEWSLGDSPWKQGFDDFAGFLNEQEAKNYNSDSIWRYAPKSIYNETNQSFDAFVGRMTLYQNPGGKMGGYMPDVFMKVAVNFVRDNHPDFANRYRPFFLLVNLPAPRSATDGKDDYPVPTDAPFTGENWPQAAKNRAALISRLDAGIGKLLDQMKNDGMTNNVVIFFTGAVAPEKFANTNMNFLKLPGEMRGGTSEEHLRVPMIVHWPQHVLAGRVSKQPWSPADFGPTALQIAYAKPAPNFAGISMLPALLGEPGTNSPAAPDLPELPRSTSP